MYRCASDCRLHVYSCACFFTLLRVSLHVSCSPPFVGVLENRLFAGTAHASCLMETSENVQPWQTTLEQVLVCHRTKQLAGEGKDDINVSE